ncbi:MAG: GNAT family N-acetyltransferase [Methanobrevibacter sp.]|uniref:GNAT family N-acetyltransferase n=1 Tax=Methanobrevibacter sp. TaxID=66852 RepID=UPI0025DBBC55|nr:GNAT family protein [Methanobrevibacter sp.]MBQ6098508.1 GNAT family N-acetyltransferase [Methanobrevibacter sp.]
MIEGKFVGLRAIEHEDLHKFLEWRNKPELRKNFREYKELSFSNQENWFNNIVLKSPNNVMFAIVNLEDNELIGACGLNYIDWVNRNADLSIYIGLNGVYIDDVFAPDATKLLLDYGFDELNLHRIYVEIYDIDLKKQKLLEDLDFNFDGLLRETHWTEGKWCNSLFYSILKSEY